MQVCIYGVCIMYVGTYVHTYIFQNFIGRPYEIFYFHRSENLVWDILIMKLCSLVLIPQVKNWKETAKDRRTWRDLAEKAKTHKGL